MDLDIHEPLNNVSYEGMIEDKTSETRSIALGSGQHVEEPITTFLEILASYVNHIFTNQLGLPLTHPPSTRYFDAFSSYNLPPSSTTTQCFGVNPSSFGFPKELENLSFSTTPVVDTVGASSLLKTLVTQLNLTQPFAMTSPFTHGSGNIPASLFPHIHTPSTLLGHSIGHIVEIQVVHTTKVIEYTQPPCQPFHMSTPYIGGQSSMGGQPLAGGNL
jgi:hypothetical protein